MKQRYQVTVEYDGRPFVGWQRQTNGLSVQQVFEEAVARLCGNAVRAYAAGRTDSGVHASGQVVHVDLARNWPGAKLCAALNFFLRPHPVSVLSCTAVSADFDARFSAIGRHYQYRIINRSAPLTHAAGLAWLVRAPLNIDVMRSGAEILVGHHDFSTFRDARCQARNPVRTLDAINITVRSEEIMLWFSARSFLHRQVRSMVGALKHVAEGRWAPADLEAALIARRRSACAPVAPADGLYLMRIDYRNANAGCGNDDGAKLTALAGTAQNTVPETADR